MEFYASEGIVAVTRQTAAIFQIKTRPDLRLLAFQSDRNLEILFPVPYFSKQTNSEHTTSLYVCYL